MRALTSLVLVTVIVTTTMMTFVDASKANNNHNHHVFSMQNVVTNETGSCPKYPTSEVAESAFKYQDFSYQVCETYGIATISACVRAQCDCLGLPHDPRGCDVSEGKSNATCSAAAACVNKYITCVNEVAPIAATVGTPSGTLPPSDTPLPTKDNCTNWGSRVHLEQVPVLADAIFYNESYLFESCRSASCSILYDLLHDVTGTCGDASNEGSVVLPTTTMCVSPVMFFGTLTLSGNFTKNFNERYLELAAALKIDLTNLLRFEATIRKMALGSLIVDFSVPVSSENEILKTGIANAVASTDWLSNTKAEFVLLGGDLSTLSVQSLVPTVVATNTPAPDPPAPDHASDSISGSAIAGIILGGLVFLLIVGGVGYLCYKRRMNEQDEKLNQAVGVVGGGVKSRHERNIAARNTNGDPYGHYVEDSDEYEMDQV